MKNALLIVFLTLSGLIFGQNLVLNPSFDATQCPIFSPDPAEYIAPWTAISPSNPPDYYHNRCGISGSPATTNNSQPFDGEGFIGIEVYGNTGTYYRRNYIQGELDEPLEEGKYYRVTFFVKPVNSINHTLGVDNIGLFFSDSALDNSALGPDSVLNVEPHIKSTNVIAHSSYWTSICGVYMAKGGEQFFTIGNFYSDLETNFAQLDSLSNPRSSYYLVDLVEVVENDFPQLPKDTIICEQGRIDLDLRKIDFKYLWDDGTTGGKYTITEEGIYSVRISSPNCSYYDTLKVELVECLDCKMFVPTAFTPNGDGKNETFQLKSTCADELVDYRLQVYDRWGQKVFESTDISVSWDGLDVNHLGTFTYNLVFTYDQKRLTKTETRRGYVTLIK